MSKERAVNFDARQVRATLNGTMTQFRRLLRKHAAVEDGYRCPFGQPGDRLWVRETWGYDQDGPHTGPVLFRADRDASGIRWRPSIHMPRWASRLTLEVVDVRVQRIQDISEDDARAEGVVPPDVHAAMTQVLENPADNGAFHRKAFRAVWDSLDPGGWDRNPWVWAVSFRQVTP